MLKKTLEASILQYMLEFTDQIKRGGDILLQEHDLTSQQWTILLHLAKDPNLPFFKHRSAEAPILASELAQHFNVSRANITNLILSLSEKKLITQEEDDYDRRRKFLKLTSQGKKLVKSIESLREEANNKLFARCTQDEKELFMKIVDHCMTHLQEEQKAAQLSS